MANKKIAILGNCQAQFLEGLFLTAATGIAVDRLKPVFELTPADQSSVLSIFEGADLIFTQRVASDYHLEWVRPEYIRQRFGSKSFLWPNIYFDGYFPDAQYIYLGEYGKLQGPLDDYHLQGILAAHRAKTSIPAVVAQLESVDQPRFGDAFRVSLNKLREREQDVDILISDYLSDEVGKRRCFYTPNHPFNFVLVEMARRMAEKGEVHFDIDRAGAFNYRLDRIYIPGYRAILKSHNVQFDETYVYRGLHVDSVSDREVILGGAADYTIETLVRAYYALYDKVFGKP